MQKNKDRVHYPLPDIEVPIESPSYPTVLDWMKTTRGRRVTFDFWARGNYTRRLLYNHSNNIAPLLIQIENIKEIAWAYKHLALLGLPIDFIYAGKCEKAKVLHLCPWDIILDSGWGYVGALGSKANIKGRYFFPIIGHAKLMPEAILDFLVEELSEEFLKGNVFVAPAELIGLNPKAPQTELLKHSELTGGAPVLKEDLEIKTILEINIPFIDNLSIAEFRKLIHDYGDHLIDFRNIFHEFVAARYISEEKGNQLLHHMQSEINNLLKSDRHLSFRNIISVLGGVLCLTAATISATSGDISSVLAFAGATLSSVRGATEVHQYLRERMHNKYKKISASPYALLWKLGMTKPSKFKAEKQIYLGPAPKQTPSEFDANSDYHWLCPPTKGIHFLDVKEN